jgi:hypothetical protein
MADPGWPASRRSIARYANVRSLRERLSHAAVGLCHYGGRVSGGRDSRVDAYIDVLPRWQQEICHIVRDLVHRADADVQETIKRSVQPYFVLDGNICALLATKDHVNVFIYDPTVPDPTGLINQGHHNATAKTIQIHQDDDINEEALLELFHAVIGNNRAGGWRRLPR